MSYETILYEERDGVALITYNRPESRNALSVRMYRETVAAFEQANADDAIGAIVVTANGPVFCAGADFKDRSEPPDASGRRPSVGGLGMTRDTGWLHLLTGSKPSIFAVNGPAIGLGVTHILAGDVRIASATATFSFPFLRRSVMPEFGASALLPRLVGFGRALDICLRSSELDAAEALRIGLVTQVTPPEQLVETAVALGSTIAAYPHLQVKLTKEMFHGNADESDLNAILTRESRAFVTMMKVSQSGPKPQS